MEVPELPFSVKVHRDGSEVTSGRYVIQKEPRRVSRSTVYEPWSDWEEVSIPDESVFPDYGQHLVSGCAVGCGPVAWALIFGYYDRRSHINTTYGNGSWPLYRDGWNGTSGNDSEVAPRYSDDRMQRYTEALNSILGTWCMSDLGLTYMGRMSRVQEFFAERQQTGSPRIVTDSWLLTNLGGYNDEIAAWSRDRLSEGWPVVVTTKDSWFSGWHYPVATRFRRRERRYRSCYDVWLGTVCLGWDAEISYDMYLHMGWHGYGNGWYNMETFFSAAAVY